MKRRNGFVSNSSSSSYVCDSCGDSEVGYEGVSDVGMFECENGHTICDGHRVTVEEEEWEFEKIKNFLIHHFTENYDKKELLYIKAATTEEELDEYEDYLPLDVNGGYDEVAWQCCPICTLEEIPYEYVCSYLSKKYGISEESWIREIQEKFGNLEELEAHLEEE